MEKKVFFLITATILTIILSVTFFFFDFYNYHFEFKKDRNENTYVVLKNGRYFVFLCSNDVIDNEIDFSLKPFNDFRVKNSGNMFKHNVLCLTEDGKIQKDTILKRSLNTIKVEQTIQSDLNIPKNSLYYTHLEYPLISEVKEGDGYLELYDLNCTTKIFKEDDYEYKVIDNFIRIGKKHSKNFNITFEMKIECL